MNRIKCESNKTSWSLHFPLFSCDWTGGLSWKSGRSSRKYVLCSCLFSPVWRDDLPLLSRKIKGVGSIFIVGCVIGSFFLFSRHGAGAFIPALIAGSFAEMVASSGRFRSNLRNALSFVIFAFATTGPILMMWFYPASYRMSLLDRGKSIDYVNRVMVSPDLATITWFVLTVILGAGLGWGLSYILQSFLTKRRGN